MSKRLKRRIQELCGLINLNREEKLRKANEILNSSELKQQICNQILGATFKDIERTMTAIMKERQLTEYQQEMLELEQEAPEKFDPEFEFKVNQQASDRKKENRYTTYSRGEVLTLLTANPVTSESESYIEPTYYPPLEREVAERLIQEHFEHKERERIKKEQIWEIQKTIESVTKTAAKTKPSKSTKGSK